MRTANAPDELTASDARGGDPSADRVCLACGYSLRGLGGEPRCPECGLLNIPHGYRQQVWELVDSGRWFFSSFFGVFAKRPPGWWWALDRPDDLRRARRFAMWHLGVSMIITLAAVGIGDAFCLEVRGTSTGLYPPDQSNQMVVINETVVVIGFAARQIGHNRETHHEELAKPGVPAKPRWRVTRRRLFEPGWTFLPIAGLIFAAAFLIWAVPATVGIWTQIRQGLPEFARAPNTIIAASLCETHRVTYVAVGVLAWVGVDAFCRFFLTSGSPLPAEFFLRLPAVALAGWAVMGWIGPLRSDYTAQLIRSRLHATRVLLMYALVFPCAMVVAIFAGGWYFLWSE